MKRIFRLLRFLHFIGQTNPVLCTIVVHFICLYASKFNFTNVDNTSDSILYYPLKLIFSRVTGYYVVLGSQQEICHGTPSSESFPYTPFESQIPLRNIPAWSPQKDDPSTTFGHHGDRGDLWNNKNIHVALLVLGSLYVSKCRSTTWFFMCQNCVCRAGTLRKFCCAEANVLSDCFFKCKWHFNKLCNKSTQHIASLAITDSFGDKPYIIVQQILPISVFYVSTSVLNPHRRTCPL